MRADSSKTYLSAQSVVFDLAGERLAIQLPQRILLTSKHNQRNSHWMRLASMPLVILPSIGFIGVPSNHQLVLHEKMLATTDQV